jgi:hypothetical protein
MIFHDIPMYYSLIFHDIPMSCCSHFHDIPMSSSHVIPMSSTQRRSDGQDLFLANLSKLVPWQPDGRTSSQMVLLLVYYY